MMLGMRGKTLLVWLVVWATLVVTAGAHWHPGAAGAGCDVCLCAHLPVLQPPVSVELSPPVPLEWQIASEDFHRALESLSISSATRAPPA
jgi:hypothetical protein